MPARRKWRRKLTVRGQQFLWYVREDPDGMGRILHLFTPDKALVAWYWREVLRCYGSYVLVVSEHGAQREVTGHPPWETRKVVTPRFVAELADWLLGHRGSARLLRSAACAARRPPALPAWKT
jgi:hypothetical protein